MARSLRTKRRAAVSAARRSRSSRGWYALSALVVAVGVFLIVISRNEAVSPKTGEHWHAAFGVNICGQWLENAPKFHTSAANTAQNAGVHTHGDGLIHIHPFVNAESGKKATVGRFMEYGGWETGADSFTLWDGAEHKTGDKCGEKDAVVRWELNGELQSGDVSNYKPNDGDVIALALLPEDEQIGDPPAAAQLQDPLAAEEGRELTGPTVPVTGSVDSVPTDSSLPADTSAPGDTAAPTETTTAAETATTVAP
ncbi:MAG: hypothetical protein ACT4OX_09380 [Actinomycetota bacterium]